ncbi:glycoside hydrolase family 2 protein [Streptomyces sp. 150FB]|uniref:glycoside hydrolase family 2 protein n=1 Tax=Streptomyces sp. 150FB TaxID=1576605 RepID=UPI00099C3ACE|nr:glycoside hydrolase family 2 protein [Streptomyces sp. 150FB]
MLVASAPPGPWTLRAVAAPDSTGPVPPQVAGTVFAAQVPGCVHSDLLAAHALPDPYLDANEERVAWVGRTDWAYATRLPRTDDGFERTDLVFEGLDTFAGISVDGVPVGATSNMHRGYRFDVTEYVARRDSDLTVAFTSAYTVAEALEAELGPRPNAYPEPFNYVRKMASSFGWDWGPKLVTAGIWRPVRIERWSTARLASVAPQVTVRDGDGHVTVRVTVERTAAGAGRELRLRVNVAGCATETLLPAGQAAGAADLRVPSPTLWWPHTLGAPNLHELTVTLEDAESGERLDDWGRRVGFRMVELDTTPDAMGSAFRFVVNGVPVFTRGVNWIPDDALPSRVTAERYRTRLEQAKAANIDLVRVWGGGIYEDEAFYAACDELGLMVWQDFPFACAAYPEEGPLPAEIEAEARENVVRLMPHPSLVLWNGNNENLWGHEDWDWKGPLAGRTWGRGYYLELLPRIVAELDPTRPYWAGSPWSGSPDIHPNDVRHGTTHLWEEWNRRPYTDYLTTVPRFVAEFGWQAPPAMATVRRSISDRPLLPDSPGMLHHQKAEDGNGKLARGLAPYFNAPDDFDTWHYLTQLNQARAIATGIEHWRANWPLCSGTVVWQLNDCWPVTSWAAIDGDGHLKPLYYELRRLYADRLLTLQHGPDGLLVTAVNQSGSAWPAAVELRRVRADGTTAAHATVHLRAAPRAVARVVVPESLTQGADADTEFWVADCEGLRAVHFAAPDKDFAYPVADYGIEVTADDDTARITVTARTLLRDLLLQADRLDPAAATDRGRVTLLPGEQVTFTVTGWPTPNAQAVPAALFCVNDAAGPHTG